MPSICNMSFYPDSPIIAVLNKQSINNLDVFGPLPWKRTLDRYRRCLHSCVIHSTCLLSHWYVARPFKPDSRPNRLRERLLQPERLASWFVCNAVNVRTFSRDTIPCSALPDQTFRWRQWANLQLQATNFAVAMSF